MNAKLRDAGESGVEQHGNAIPAFSLASGSTTADL